MMYESCDDPEKHNYGMNGTEKTNNLSTEMVLGPSESDDFNEPLMKPLVYNTSTKSKKYDPPSDHLTTSERQARLSQLPTVHCVKANPRKFDPEDPLSPSERQARTSLLPGVKELKKSLSSSSTGSIVGANGRLCITLVGLVVVVSAILITVPLVVRRNKMEMERTDEVMAFLANNEISKIGDLKTIDSPQNKAAIWIANHDKLALPLSSERAFIDRYVLAVLFFGLGGDTTWPDTINFLSGDNICTWWKDIDSLEDSNIKTYNHPIVGVSGCVEVDGELTPTAISLPFHGLYGQIPDEIQFLKYLRALFLQYNPALSGELPSSIAALTDLRTLSLQHCSLSGDLPEWIGDLTKLTSLELGHNGLMGPVPASLRKLTNLVQLGLDDNFLGGDIQMFGTLTNLRALFLEGNQIQGTLTSELLLEKWNKMGALDLSNNRISSNIPEDIFSHPSLRVLDLHDNLLTGRIPFVKVEMNTQLEVLALQNNLLNMGIPNSINLLRNLQHLDVSGNALGSTLPSTLGTMFHLNSLFLGNNNFIQGPIPSFLANEMVPLEELSLPDARLTGGIPANIWNRLTRLRYLDLGKNELTGPIPSEIASLSDLRYLLLRENQLTGTLSDAFSRLSNLDVLLLEGNQLTGSIDHICQGSVKISFLTSDCGGQQPEISCSCCSICCSEKDDNCNNLEWSANLDPNWEYNYVRNEYDFGQGMKYYP